MTFYHRTKPANAKTILASGFKDGTCGAAYFPPPWIIR
jgi:hypothetical protein